MKEVFVFNNFSNFEMTTTNICTTSLLEKKKEIEIADNLLLPNHHLIRKTH